MGSDKNLNPKLLLLPAILSIWLIASAFASYWSDASTFLVALALLTFTTIMALTNIFKFSGWFAAVLSILGFGLIQLALNGLTPAILVPVGIQTVILIMTAWLGTVTAQEIIRVNRQLNNDQKLIEELRLYDPETGLLRYNYVSRSLRTEIIRSQRYDKNLSVILLRIGNLEEIESEHGQEGVDAIKRQVAELLSGSLRAMDIPFGGEKLGAILPETSLEGTEIVVNRLISNASRKARAALHIGASQFPADGVTESELIQSAEAALQISLTTGRPYIEYSQVQSAAQSVHA